MTVSWIKPFALIACRPTVILDNLYPDFLMCAGNILTISRIDYVCQSHEIGYLYKTIIQDDPKDRMIVILQMGRR
jgi:hypothetical protein